MARNDDNAKNWSMGDMNKDQQELEDHWVVDSTTFMTEAEWERAKAVLLRNAKSQGKSIGTKKVKGGYRVTVEHKEKRPKKK